MGGGLMQLVAYGAQDIYLTGNPQITFFKVVYRRHTNFSMESIEQTFSGSVASNGRTTATVSRNGDLVHKMYIQHTLHSTSIQNESAVDIDSVELEIGGQRIDKHFGKWMEVWAELTENTTGRVLGTNYQVTSGMGMGLDGSTAVSATTTLFGSTTSGNVVAQAADNDPAAIDIKEQAAIAITTQTANLFNCPDMDSRVVYTPLQFWFCRNPGLALPLIALQYHEVKVIVNWGTITNTSPDHKLWVDYIYLDTDERRRFAQVSHEYLIEQVQHETFATGKTNASLNFNHPVKELVLAGAWGADGTLAALDGSSATTMTLKLNGHERFAPRPLTYFTRTQVLQHHSGEGGLADLSIGVYSFALKPEEHQPSGTCNFSRIDNAQLSFSAAMDAFDVYAVNYNVLRIMSGMGGLAYSN